LHPGVDTTMDTSITAVLSKCLGQEPIDERLTFFEHHKYCRYLSILRQLL
jgi:hypothetical protein